VRSSNELELGRAWLSNGLEVSNPMLTVAAEIGGRTLINVAYAQRHLRGWNLVVLEEGDAKGRHMGGVDRED
jgi:hypothetical protein